MKNHFALKVKCQIFVPAVIFFFSIYIWLKKNTDNWLHTLKSSLLFLKHWLFKYVTKSFIFLIHSLLSILQCENLDTLFPFFFFFSSAQKIPQLTCWQYQREIKILTRHANTYTINQIQHRHKNTQELYTQTLPEKINTYEVYLTNDKQK